MGKCEDYKEKVKEETLWVPNSQLSHIPDVIIKEYELLHESIEKDDVCGALFRLKDIYEISIKLPSIYAIISISSYIEKNNDFISLTGDEITQERDKYISGESNTNIESKEVKNFGEVLSRLLKEPLSIGSWNELANKIIKTKSILEVDDILVDILNRTIELHKVTPSKANGENDNYDNFTNWRNKTIGHGTLLINTEDYWHQVHDLVERLYTYLSGDEKEQSLSDLYSQIKIEENDNDNSKYDLKVGNNSYPLSEYIYSKNNEYYYFDSYYSRKNYTEITNYNAPERLEDSTYYKALYSLCNATKKESSKKGKTKRKSRSISTSEDREMYACLKSTPEYEQPTFIIDEINKYINENDKGVLYIQMERGMGKSTLAHNLDGRYQEGFLQKDLQSVVRVYHINDMMLRNENRAQDFYTALDNNLSSYNGGQLEIDNEDYFDSDGKDFRSLITENSEEEASMALCQLLEMFRLRYEYEIVDDDSDDEINLVYIIDGIDELNSDTRSILNAIPDGAKMQNTEDEEVNHVYIILLSRTPDEDNLPTVAKECIEDCEKKANKILTINSNNKDYYDLLKQYITKNYNDLSDDAVCKIIENAQRKFLYIQPYLAMGDAVITQGKSITAYDVARNYIGELQKLYFGTSLHTLQLIISSIATFHTISLQEICNLIIFTDVSYDVIGVLNDILPLLTTKRTDGDDTYSFANEEYEKFVFDNMGDAVCEVIRRYRISMVSWFESTDKNGDDYGKQWGYYIKRALLVDRVAKETTEEYIKALIELCGRDDPETVYSRSVYEELEADIIEQLRLTKYRDLELLSSKDLQGIFLLFRASDYEEGGLSWKRREFTKEIIEHCVQKGTIDVWFEYVISEKMDLRAECQIDNHMLNAFSRIVKAWPNQEIVIDYLNQKIQDDLKENKNYPYKDKSYGVYLEQLLTFVKEERLRKKIFVGLLNAYDLLAKVIILRPGWNDVDEKRKEIMREYLLEAERKYTSLRNYSLIEEIKDAIFGKNTDKAIEQLNMLAESVYSNNSEEYARELKRLRLREENLTEDQIRRYRQAQIKNYQSIINHIKKLLDEQNIEGVYNWLDVCWWGDINSFTVENEGLLTEYLSLYEKLVMVCVEEGNIKRLSNLERTFYRFLLQYDEKVRKKSIGLYIRSHRGVYWDRPVDQKQEMTSWERTYALYCSSLGDFDFCNMHDAIPIVANDFTNKYLQDLYLNEEFELYNKLNCRIMETYENIEFRKNYIFILSGESRRYRLIINYYRWLTVRYYRSVEGKDNLSSELLYERLEEEYAALLNRVKELLSNESDLIHRNTLSGVRTLIKELLFLSKMIPDSICTVEDAKDEIVSMIDALVETTSSNNEVKELAARINNTISEPLEWFNTDAEFTLDMTDKSLLE